MTGLLVVLAAVVLTAGFGLYRQVTDGRLRAVSARAPRLRTDDLGAPLGGVATLVQFSSRVCAPCRAARAVLSEVASATAGVAHVEVDAEERLDLANRFSILRTPTVLVLDSGGRVRHRIVGPPRLPEVLDALSEVGVRV